MARPPATTLLQALSGTAVGEDSLTDGLAYLLKWDIAVAKAFGELFGLDGVDACTHSQTQVGVPGGRVDLEVVLTCGGHGFLLLVEAKTFTTDRENQLKTYMDAQDYRRGKTDATHAEVVTLAPIGNPIEETAREHGLKHISWQQILTSLVLIGAHRADPDWREKAANRTAAVELRDLLDYCWILRKRGVAVDVDPIQKSDDLVARRAEELLNPHGVVGALLDAAADLDGYAVDGRYAEPRGLLALTVGRVLTTSPEGVAPDSWWLTPEGLVNVTLQLWFSTSDAQRCTLPDAEPGTPPDAEPGFLAGVIIQGPHDQPIPSSVRTALDDPSWRRQLPPGVYVGDPDDNYELWIVGTKPLSDLGTRPGLAAQMELLREWACTTLARVLAVDKPPRWPEI